MKKRLITIITTFIILALLPVNVSAATDVQVKGVKAKADTGMRSIKVSWNKVSKANGYYVFRDTKKIGITTKLSHIDRNRTVNATYKYQVQAYRYKYYNKKTKKWQYKKPYPKNWKKCPKGKHKGKKTIKVVYGKKSVEKSGKVAFKLKVEEVGEKKVRLTWTNFSNYYYCYKDGNYAGYTRNNSTSATGLTPGTEYKFQIVYKENDKEFKSNTVKVKTTGEKPEVVDDNGENNENGENAGSGENAGNSVETPDVYLDTFANTRIYLGQSFSEVSATLANNANGTWSFNRQTKKVYLYNTNTYEDFLAVYVGNGVITSWVSNSETMGVVKGNAYTRTSWDHPAPVEGESGAWHKYNSDSTMYMMGFLERGKGNGNNGGTGTENDEKNYEVHLVNAVRQVAGGNPVQRNIHLEGVNFNNGDKRLAYSGKARLGVSDITTVSNARYGTQALSDACDEQQEYLAHDAMHSSWPDRLCQKTLIAIASYKATGEALDVIGENAAMGGSVESIVSGWVKSYLHRLAMLNPDAIYIGVGIGRYGNYQQFAEPHFRPSVYDKYI